MSSSLQVIIYFKGLAYFLNRVPLPFQQVPPAYAPHGTSAEDELLGPWLWDDLAVEDGEPAQTPLNQLARPRRRKLVYLDDYAPKVAPAAGKGTEGNSRAGRGEQPSFAAAATSPTPGGNLMPLADDGDEESLSTQNSAVLNHVFRQQRSQMRNPEFDYDTWFFRTGRFRSS